MHKGGTAEQRSPSSDRSVTLLEETYANSNSPKTRLSYMGMMEMDSSDQQAEEQEEFNTRQVELTCEDEEIILSSPDSMDRRNVETAELKTPAALSPSWYHMDRTVLVNQKKFKPTTPLTVVAGPSGTRVIDRRKPKMPAPVQYFKVNYNKIQNFKELKADTILPIHRLHLSTNLLSYR